MKNRQAMLWVLATLLLLSFIAAVSIPNLLRSRMAANESSLVAKSRNPQETGLEDKEQGRLALDAMRSAVSIRANSGGISARGNDS